MKILITALAVQLISGKPQGHPTPHDVSDLAALFGGTLRGSTELSIHLGVGEGLALKVTADALATLKGIQGGINSNGDSKNGVDATISTTAGAFNDDPHYSPKDVKQGAAITHLPMTGPNALHPDYYLNLKRHDGQAGDVILQIHG